MDSYDRLVQYVISEDELSGFVERISLVDYFHRLELYITLVWKISSVDSFRSLLERISSVDHFHRLER